MSLKMIWIIHSHTLLISSVFWSKLIQTGYSLAQSVWGVLQASLLHKATIKAEKVTTIE